VRIWGEDPTEERATGPDAERAFTGKSRPIQAAVLLAGVTMNVVLAFFLYTVSYLVGMPTAVSERVPGEAGQLLVTNVLPGSPASEVLQSSDQILAVSYGSSSLSVDTATSTESVAHFIAASAGAPIALQIVRRDAEISLAATPVTGLIADDPGRYALGIGMTFIATEEYSLLSALQQAGVRTYEGLRDILVGFGVLLSDLVQGSAELSSVTGPVGIVGMVGDAASLGVVWLLTFSAFISLNLAVINLLPIPALDGGRLLFVLIESIMRRPIAPRFAQRANTVGFVFLLGLMAVVTLNDVVQIFF
jgi:regulator of sigma E protease